MKHLVIGLGEVGQAIMKVLADKYEVQGIDKNPEAEPWPEFDVLHICIPFTDQFVGEVVRYQQEYLLPGGLTIIHSTVPIGTCDKVKAVHSPIRGVHPNLYEGVKSFIKYFGGERAWEAANYFLECGMKVKTTPDARNTEGEKLWETEQYRELILLNKRIYEFCEKNGLDFDFVYTQANQDYNDGYMKLGRPEVVRPWLRYIPGPIGGHCVEPNHKLLNNGN